ncbi:hypothetical protein ACA910_004958 [Epithemia clementina (nom. ined.)]
MKIGMLALMRQLVLVVFLVVLGMKHLPSERSLLVGSHSGVPKTPDAESNKTLVVLMGNLRGGEKAWETLQNRLLKVNNADLALLIGETRDAYHNSSLFQRANYVWTIPEYDDWADAIDLISGPSWRNRLLPLIYEKSWVFGGIKGHQYVGSGSIGLMMRWFLSQRLQQLQREGQLDKYSRFVITRSDHFYLCDHDLAHMSNAIESGLIMVPKGEDYGGITDRHLVVGRKTLFQSLNVLPPILEDPKRYAHLFDDTHGNNLESLLAYRWMEEGLIVQRFDRVMFVCGEDGDMTRTVQLGMQLPDGLRLKYPKEYVASYMTCGKELGVVHY